MIPNETMIKMYTVKWTETRTVEVVAPTAEEAVLTAMNMSGEVERRHGYRALKEDYIVQETDMVDELPKDELVWRSVLDQYTCDICRALHNAPIVDLTASDLLHFKGHNGCHAANCRGCRCYVLNVTKLKSALIREIGGDYSFKRVGDALRNMEAHGMISRKESIHFLAKCMEDECYKVRSDIIDHINNFKFTEVQNE